MEIKSFLLGEVFEFLPKSKHKAGDGLKVGKYPFFTSSQQQSKWFNEVDYEQEAIVLGTGGVPSVHCAKNFSTSTDVFVMSPSRKEISTKYVYYFFLCRIDILEKGFKGAGLKHLSREYTKKIWIPFPADKDGNPDLAEQKRIVTILEEAEGLNKKRVEVDKKMGNVVPALFSKLFENRGWKNFPISDIAEVKIGPFGTQLHAKDYIENGIPLINPTHIVEGRIKTNNRLTISIEKVKALPQYVVRTGDVVLGRRGEMGRCAVVTEIEDGYICGTGSLFLSPKTNKINPAYLQKVLSSKSIKKVLEENAKGITMKNLNIPIVNEVKIPLPPLALQNQFAEVVKAIEMQEVKQKQSAEKIDLLFQALLSRYFSI